MKISIGSDHRGVQERASVARHLEQAGHQVIDQGTDSDTSCDYPDIARQVAEDVIACRAERGLLICGTGIGMAIAANKLPGVRAVVVHDPVSAEMSRRHNDANVICLSGDILGQQLSASGNANQPQLLELLDLWLKTEFEGGRHARRVDKIAQLAAAPTNVTQ